MSARSPSQTPTPETPAADTTATVTELLAALNEQLLKQGGGGAEALNRQVVESVSLLNAELAAQAPNLAAQGQAVLVRQAAGLVAQSAASYFDGVTKLALAAQGVLLRQMAENIVNDHHAAAAENACAALNTHLLVGGAAAIAAASGAIDAEGVNQALERITQFSEQLSERTRNA